MKPPTGFLSLHDTIYIVGGKMWGSGWCPISRLEDRQAHTVHVNGVEAVVLTGSLFNPQTEEVITIVAKACERGEITAVYRSIDGGAAGLNRDVWRRPHWQYYFAHGTIDDDLLFVDHNLRPNADGRTVRCTREIYLRQQDIDRLVKTLPTPQKNTAGAPKEHEWEDYRQKFQQLWQQNGDFRSEQNQVQGWNSQAAAARMLLDYIQPRCEENKEPHEKTVAEYIARWVKEIDSGA